jgi:very-short-patch-repair endonuclease
MTPAERALWQELRCRKLGVMFRRQEPVSGYIVDFYASPVQVAVEVDGNVHDEQIAYDERRNDKLQSLNVRVLRFRNEDVFNDRERVVARIREVVDERLRSMPFRVTRVRPP